MARLPVIPDSSDLNPVAPQAAESFTNIPVANYAGAAGSIAQGLSSAGNALSNYATTQYQKQAAQERFDTKMKLLSAEQTYQEQTKDLDPMDPQYVQKLQAARKDTFYPVLQGVQYPENRQLFEVSTKDDFVRLTAGAEQTQKAAYGKDAEIKVGTYVDTVQKGILDGSYKGDPVSDVTQTIRDNQHLDHLTQEALIADKTKVINSTLVDADFKKFATSGVSVTPEVQHAIDTATAVPGTPAWMGSYLARSATIESAGGRNKVNADNPDVAGTWQIASGTAKDLGLDPAHRMDDASSALATVHLTMQNFNSLKAALGRDPTPGELYLAHQQGSGGAAKLLQNPGALASDVLGNSAVAQNLPESMKGQAGTITAGEFAHLWIGKFESGGTGKVNPDEALAVIRQSAAYKSLDVAGQAQAEHDIIERSKLYNDQYQKINEQNVSDGIIQSAYTTDAYGNQIIDPVKADTLVNNIADPETRKNAGELVKLQLEQQDKEQKFALEQEWNKTYSAVLQNSNNPVAARAAVDASKLPAEKKDALYKRITEGSKRQDDPATYHGLLSLYYADPKAFVAATDNWTPYTHRLTDETMLKMKGWRDEINKANGGGDKVSSETMRLVGSAGSKIDDKLKEIGIDPSAKPDTADGKSTDAHYAGMIRDITQKELELKIGESLKSGKPVMDSDVNAIVNGVFKNYPVTKNSWWSGNYTVNQSIKDILPSDRNEAAGVVGAITSTADKYEEAGADILAQVSAMRAAGVPVTADTLTQALEIYKARKAKQ